MKWLNPMLAMLLFGMVAIGGLAVYLMLFQGSPGPLAAPHAEAIHGSSIRSCKQCHTEQGLTAGCLHCHVEIAEQLDRAVGYHAYLLKGKPVTCEQCHPDHNGADFQLAGPVAWNGLDRENFSHPHVDFTLAGSHDGLACEKCHVEKEPPTFLGLEQGCASCHKDVHGSGGATRTCSKCHDQNQFKPAAFFNHDEYYLLKGAHSTAACADCHQQSETGFGPVKGKACIDCHESPHRFKVIPQQDCKTCHFAEDESWGLGRRGIDPSLHATFGFPLESPHADRSCGSCHKPDLPYSERYLNPEQSGYLRQPDQCRGCHADPHAGQFIEKHPACRDCHRQDGFIPSLIGPGRHSETYPLQGAHQAVSCVQCHEVDASGVRQFTSTPTACKDCHADPHEGKFQDSCTACHLSDASTFRIKNYPHQNQLACSACHSDVHRGQFLRSGITECKRCHGSTEKWSAGNFVHDRDARFALAGAHAKVACTACHSPVPQPDGKTVVQYQPLTTRCEDCHGFISK